MNHLITIDGNKVVLSGRVDHASLSNDLFAQMDNSQIDTIHRAGTCQIDLGAVDYIDSAGLAWLINAIKYANTQKIALSLVSVPEKLIKLAKISDVDQFLPLE